METLIVVAVFLLVFTVFILLIIYVLSIATRLRALENQIMRMAAEIRKAKATAEANTTFVNGIMKVLEEKGLS